MFLPFIFDTFHIFLIVKGMLHFLHAKSSNAAAIALYGLPLNKNEIWNDNFYRVLTDSFSTSCCKIPAFAIKSSMWAMIFFFALSTLSSYCSKVLSEKSELAVDWTLLDFPSFKLLSVGLFKFFEAITWFGKDKLQVLISFSDKIKIIIKFLRVAFTTFLFVSSYWILGFPPLLILVWYVLLCGCKPN